MKRGTLLKCAALVIDVGVPAAATLSHLPLWVSRGSEATLSGLCLFLLVLSAVPLLRHLGKMLASPSVFALWGIAFLLFAALRSVIDELVVISFFGFVANAVGALLYNIGDRMERRARLRAPRALDGGNE